MTRPCLLLTRPQEEVGRTAEAARAAGFDVMLAPLLEIYPIDWTPPPGEPEALLFTSARSPAFVAAAQPGLRRIKAYAVGARTGEVAIESGFHVVATGEGDGSAALALAKRDGVLRLLHLAGEATAPLDVPPGLRVDRRAVYTAQRVDRLPQAVVSALAAGSVFATMLFSARTAAHFAGLVDEAGLGREALALVALSPAVAAAAGQGWRQVAIAQQPSLSAAFAAARRMWQGDGHD